MDQQDVEQDRRHSTLELLRTSLGLKALFGIKILMTLRAFEISTKSEI